MHYTGNEICQGCKKPGKEAPRDTKNSLCWTCEKLIAKGRAVEFQDREHKEFFMHYHAYYSNTVNGFVHTILKAISNDAIQNFERDVHGIKWKFGSNGRRYTIPSECYEPLKSFFQELDDRICKIEETEKNMPETVRKAVFEEKTKIYNEGIERGRNLLLQLESGGLTMEDFAKNLPYHTY